MLLNLVFYALALLGRLFTRILPDADFWPLPAGLSAAFSGISSIISNTAAILPDGTLSNMVAALSLVTAVNLFVIPWLAARNFRLPFAAATKKE